MSGFWMGGLQNDWGEVTATSRQTGAAQAETRAEMKELQRQVERLSLLNQALWEILRERLSLTDADLENMAREVDMRDGVADDKMTAQPVRCPSCNRVCNSRHAKCIYCGQLFERPMFG